MSLASLAPAQNTYYVNAETGLNSYSGTSPTAAWQTITHALANIPAPAFGTFNTLRIAGRYANGTNQVIVHGQSLETWSSGPRQIPASLQILYDRANSDYDATLGYAPVIIDAQGSPSLLFQFNATTTEPSSRIDGTNSGAGSGYQASFIIIRNAPLAVSISPALWSGGLPPIPTIPPGASFRRVRFENCAGAIEVHGDLPFGATQTYPYTIAPVVEECHFKSVTQTSSQQISVTANENSAPLSHNPVASLTVRDSLIEGATMVHGVYLYSRGLFSTTPTGPIGTSATITALFERTELDGKGGAAPSQYGIYADAAHFQGLINLTLKECDLHDFYSSGIWYEKVDVGAPTLSVESSAIHRCGLGASGTIEDDCGISIRGRHNLFANGYQTPTTILNISLRDSEIYENHLHGVYIHHQPDQNGTNPPIPYGTDLSLSVEGCKIHHNGFASTSARDGSGMLVNIEQGRMVGAATPLRIGSPSRIVNNDVHDNALHGIELRGFSTVPWSLYQISIDGNIADNVIDQNGYPWAGGASSKNIASNDLLVTLDAKNTGAYLGTFLAVAPQLNVTQNTFYDEPRYPMVQFLALGGAPTGNVASNSATNFYGNLGIQSTYTLGVPVFAGFVPPTQGGTNPPTAVWSNCGLFDDANLHLKNWNATTAQISTFALGANGHFVNPALRDYHLNSFAQPNNVPNVAIDRVGNNATVVPGQQLTDKDGLQRVFDHPWVSNVGGSATQSDCGAYENQGT